MRVNQETVLVGEKVVLVPYRPEHVPKYHSWMQDEELRRLTASEPLSLKEEYEMQQKWQLDEDKLTFIILSKLDSADLSAGELVPPSDSRIALLPMVGDVNIFLHGTRQFLKEGHQVKEDHDMVNDEQDDFEAEVEIMIAEPAHRRHGLAYEALQLMLGYATGTPELFNDKRHYSSPLRLPSRSLMTRITESNVPSINLFKKLDFKITKTVPVFEEVEMRWNGDLSHSP
ncbi:GNAT domain containing protein [Amanita muscaria]